MPSPTTTLDLVDGVRIVVPDSLNLITPYVLLEQQDWFEDEIKFVRRLLRPGQKVIDIGANYGVYTLSMAKAVGPTGRVWAFEPAASTAKLLAEGIAANGFGQVVLERSALSSACGTAQLSLNENSELNALVQGQPLTGASETVPLTTLDDSLKTHGWRDVDFLKIDAEGEESRILKGGERFFAELSPLVQYEIKDGVRVHLELVQAFEALGYASYRLIPGLDLIAPFEPHSTPDGFLLNLFCCKPDRAARLAAEGLLVDPAGHTPSPVAVRQDSHSYGWRQTLARLPYGAQLAGRWEQTMAQGNSAAVDEALCWYAASRDSSLASGERLAALKRVSTCSRTCAGGRHPICVWPVWRGCHVITASGRLPPARWDNSPTPSFNTIRWIPASRSWRRGSGSTRCRPVKPSATGSSRRSWSNTNGSDPSRPSIPGSPAGSARKPFAAWGLGARKWNAGCACCKGASTWPRDEEITQSSHGVDLQ